MHFRRRPLQTLTMPVIVITGANSGIGLELCKQLTARGDVVYATCRTPSAELQAVGVTGGIVTGIDVTKTSATELLQKAMRGVSIDVLINNAGGMGSKPGLTWEQQSESQKFATLDIDTLERALRVLALHLTAHPDVLQHLRSTLLAIHTLVILTTTVV